jgi:hypothetical protein
MRTILKYDTKGKLVPGVLYQFVVPLDFDIELPELANPPKNAFRPLVGRGPSSFWSGLYAELLYDVAWERNCPADATHVTGHSTCNVRADLWGGPVVCDLVPDFYHQGVIVTGRFWKRLQASGLTGIRALPLPIAVNQSTVKSPDLLVLEFTGRPCCRAPIVVVPEQNSCPFCRWAPVVCPGCLDFSYTCHNCGSNIVILPEERQGDNDLRFVAEPVPDEGLIIEGRLWDGSDFVAGHDQGFVSRRAVDWLMQEGAAPFAAKPCRVDVPETRSPREAWYNPERPDTEGPT